MRADPKAPPLLGLAEGAVALADVLLPISEGLAGDLPHALATRLMGIALMGGAADDFRALIDEIAALNRVSPFVMMGLEAIWETMLKAEGRDPPGF